MFQNIVIKNSQPFYYVYAQAKKKKKKKITKLPFLIFFLIYI